MCSREEMRNVSEETSSVPFHQELACTKGRLLTGMADSIWGEDLSSLLPVGFHEFRQEFELKKDRCLMPDPTRSSLWARRSAQMQWQDGVLHDCMSL